MPHLRGRAVAVVGQGLDEHGDALGPVPLVDDGLEACPVGALARSLRDRPLDVVLRHRVRARLLDRVLEREVGVRVGSAFLGGDHDRPRELREELAALASAAPFLCLIVDHLLCPDTHRLRHQLEKPFVDPRIVGQLRMERRDEHRRRPASSTGSPSSSARTSTSAPTSRDPGRADEDAPERPGRRPRARGPPRSSPPAARTRCARPRGRRGRGGADRARIIPAHVPKIGRPNARIASSSP